MQAEEEHTDVVDRRHDVMVGFIPGGSLIYGMSALPEESTGAISWKNIGSMQIGLHVRHEQIWKSIFLKMMSDILWQDGCVQEAKRDM